MFAINPGLRGYLFSMRLHTSGFMLVINQNSDIDRHIHSLNESDTILVHYPVCGIVFISLLF